MVKLAEVKPYDLGPRFFVELLWHLHHTWQKL